MQAFQELGTIAYQPSHQFNSQCYNLFDQDMKQTFSTPQGTMILPTFLPDATFGQVRGLDAQDLAVCGVEAVMMNSYHLMQKPGTSVVSALGDLHAFSGWGGPIFTDSGGFQAYSLIRQNSSFGNFSENGISIKDVCL